MDDTAPDLEVWLGRRASIIRPTTSDLENLGAAIGRVAKSHHHEPRTVDLRALWYDIDRAVALYHAHREINDPRVAADKTRALKSELSKTAEKVRRHCSALIQLLAERSDDLDAAISNALHPPGPKLGWRPAADQAMDRDPSIEAALMSIRTLEHSAGEAVGALRRRIPLGGVSSHAYLIGKTLPEIAWKHLQYETATRSGESKAGPPAAYGDLVDFIEELTGLFDFTTTRNTIAELIIKARKGEGAEEKQIRRIRSRKQTP